MACLSCDRPAPTSPALTSSSPTDAFRLSSPSFQANAAIASRYTCEGQDVSPSLVWEGAPPATKTLAMIVDDPDAPDPRAPQTTWVHWVVYDIPSSTSQMLEGSALPEGAREGRNDWKASGYRGPCPPIGRHRYFWKLYALDAALPDLGEPDAPALVRAMTGHVLAQATLVGTYEKKNP